MAGRAPLFLLLLFMADSDDDDGDGPALKKAKTDVANTDLALQLVAADIAAMPGRGRISAGKIRRLPNIPPANITEVNRVLTNPELALRIIMFTPLEFSHILAFVNAEIVAYGGHGTTRYRATKAPTYMRLFMLFYFLAQNPTMLAMQETLWGRNRIVYSLGPRQSADPSLSPRYT